MTPSSRGQAEPLCFLLSDLTELTTFKCASSRAAGSEEGGSPDPDAFLQISKVNPSPEAKVRSGLPECACSVGGFRSQMFWSSFSD